MNPSTLLRTGPGAGLAPGEAAATLPWNGLASAAPPVDADTALVAAARRGDLDACETLFRRYRPPMLRLAVRFLESPNEAEDAVADAFVRAFRALKSFRGEARFATWLYRITVNVCLRRQKRIRRETTEEFDTCADEAADSAGAAAVESLVEERARRRAVRRAVRSLSPKLRAVVVLHYFEDLNCEAIAEALGCSVGTVWSRLHAAKARLSQVLSRELTE